MNLRTSCGLFPESGMADVLFSFALRTAAGCLCCLGMAQPLRSQEATPVEPVQSDAPQLIAQWGIDFPRVVAFSPDERFVAIANGNSPPTIWNLGSGKKLMTLTPLVRELAGPVEGMTYVADGELLWTLHGNGYAALWDLQTAQCRKYWRAHGGTGTCLAYDNRDGLVITTGYDGCARVWKSSTGQLVAELRHADARTVLSASFLGEGSLLATAANDGCIWVWERDGNGYTPRQRLAVPRAENKQGRPAMVKMLASSRQHSDLLSATGDKISRWHLDRGRLSMVKGNLTAEEGYGAWLGDLNPAGDTLVMEDAGDDPDDDNAYVRFEDLKTRNLKKRIPADTWLGFSPSGRYAATNVSEFAGVVIHDTATWKKVATLENLILTPRNLNYSPDGSGLAVGYSDGKMACWSLASGKPRLFFSDQSKEPRDMQVRHLGNDTLLSVASARKARIWNIEEGALALLQTLNVPKEVEQSVVISPEKFLLLESDFFRGSRFHEFERQGGQWQKTSSRDMGGGFRDKEGEGLGGVFLFEPSVAPKSKLMLVNPNALLMDLQTGRRIWSVAKGLDDDEAGCSFSQFAPDERTFFTWDGEERAGRLWEIGEDKKPRFTKSLGLTRSSARAVTFSADGTEIFVGQWGGEFQAFDAKTGKETGYQRIPRGDIIAIVPSPNGSLLAGILEDATIALWRVLPAGGSGPRLKQVARLAIDREGNWMVSSPDNRFDASSLESLSLFSWIFPNDPYRDLGPEVFMRDYYEPRLLPRLLAGEKFKEVRPLQNLNRAQPAVGIIAIRPGATPGHVDIDVKVTSAVYPVRRAGQAEDMKSGAYDLRLFRDGRLVAQWPPVNDDAPVLEEGNSEVQLAAWRGAARVVEKDEAGQTITFKGIRLPSPKADAQGSPSTVEWTAYAFNEDRVKSTTARKTYALTSGGTSQPDPKAKPKAYLLGIGISSYESPGWNLQFADDDARKMIETLTPRLRGSGFEVTAEVLVSDGPKPENRQATKEAIRKALEKLAAAATPDDVVMVSFSSHGYTDAGNEFYLLPSDIGQGRARDQAPDGALLSRCISGEELSRWMRRIDSGEMVLVIDACHSAAVVQQPWFKPGPMGSRGLGQLAYDKRMRVLAASQADDFAIEASGIGQGLLTYALTIEGLEAGQSDFRPKDGRIMLGEWLANAVVRVPKLHEKLRKNEPLGGHERGGAGGRALVLTKSGGAGGERTFVPVNDEDLKVSSLTKPEAFQTPQFFDYAKDNSLELSVIK